MSISFAKIPSGLFELTQPCKSDSTVSDQFARLEFFRCRVPFVDPLADEKYPNSPHIPSKFEKYFESEFKECKLNPQEAQQAINNNTLIPPNVCKNEVERQIYLTAFRAYYYFKSNRKHLLSAPAVAAAKSTPALSQAPVPPQTAEQVEVERQLKEKLRAEYLSLSQQVQKLESTKSNLLNKFVPSEEKRSPVFAQMAQMRLDSKSLDGKFNTPQSIKFYTDFENKYGENCRLRSDPIFTNDADYEAYMVTYQYYAIEARIYLKNINTINADAKILPSASIADQIRYERAGQKLYVCLIKELQLGETLWTNFIKYLESKKLAVKSPTVFFDQKSHKSSDASKMASSSSASSATSSTSKVEDAPVCPPAPRMRCKTLGSTNY